MQYYILTLEEALKLKDTNSSGMFISPIALKTGEYGIPKNMDSFFPHLKTKTLKDYDSTKLPDGYIQRSDFCYKIDDKGKLTKADKVFDLIDKKEEDEVKRIKDEENKKKQDPKPKK